MQTPQTLDMQSVHGTLLSVLFIIMAKLFEAVQTVEMLQGAAYLATIIVAVDTLSGNKIKRYIVSKLNKYENKPKRNKPNQEV